MVQINIQAVLTVLSIIVGALSMASSLEPRILNGTLSKEQWVAELVVKFGENLKHDCGGSLIHPRWVLTAAHCLFNTSGVLHRPLNDIKILLGSLKSLAGHVFEIDKVFEHDFIDTNDYKDNDIALVKLKSSVPAEISSPVLLPKPSDVFEGQMGLAFGWGVTNTENTSPDLLQGNIYMARPDECVQNDPNFHMEKKICSITNRSLSAVCFGDSGGPLAIRNKNKQVVLVGVTSYGNCHKSDVFTKITNYIDWILSYTQNS